MRLSIPSNESRPLLPLRKAPGYSAGSCHPYPTFKALPKLQIHIYRSFKSGPSKSSYSDLRRGIVLINTTSGMYRVPSKTCPSPTYASSSRMVCQLPWTSTDLILQHHNVSSYETSDAISALPIAVLLPHHVQRNHFLRALRHRNNIHTTLREPVCQPLGFTGRYLRWAGRRCCGCEPHRICSRAHRVRVALAWSYCNRHYNSHCCNYMRGKPKR